MALQSYDVHNALKERCSKILLEKGALPTLTTDLAFLTTASGSDLPFLPFTNADEQIKYAEYVKDNLGTPDSEVAIHWNRHIVDGKSLMPKLPVHI